MSRDLILPGNVFIEALALLYSYSFTMAGTAQKKSGIHRVTTMLATSKSVIFPGHSHLLTTGTNDKTL